MRNLFIIIFLLFALNLHAQRRAVGDTSKRTVVVTSAYKPVLKPAAKINFSASTPAAETKPPVLNYNVPSQNLFFSYRPASLKPLALSADTATWFEYSNFVKFGYGNLNAPYAQAGLSFGDGEKTLFNINGKQIYQKGNLPFQEYANSQLSATGIYSTSNNVEWTGKVAFDRSSQFYYGYQPDTLQYSKDSLKQRFMTGNILLGVRNKEVNDLGVSYAPTVSFDIFTDNRKARETNLLVNAPLTKTINSDIDMSVTFVADMTSLRTINKRKVSNNLYYITPSVGYHKPMFSVNAGVTPSWDNDQFKLLPQVNVDVKVKEENFILQGGWIGYFQKNNYQHLAAFNPWIAQPQVLQNTRIVEQYAGFKGSAGSHFTYNARLAVQSYKNAALFVNDTADGKTFNVLYEPQMRALKIHGEAGYTLQEKFSVIGGLTVNRYGGLKIADKAWGLLPFELTGALRWQILKELYFKSDVFFWEGAPYQNDKGESKLQKSAFDVNAGVEFTIVPKVSLWLQFNNIMNSRYQRWNQYQVFGFNMLGGVVYSFSQANR